MARFIGGHNVLEGSLTPATASGFRLNVPGGVVSGAGDAAARGGGTASVAIRSDLVRLREGCPGPLPDNAIPALVRGVEYHGPLVRIELEAGGAREFSVTVGEKEFYAAPVEVGTNVVASWRTDAVHLLGD